MRSVVLWRNGTKEVHENVSPVVVSQERAREIERLAKEQAKHGPWSDQIDKVITPEEKAFILDLWDKMPGHTSFMDAFVRVLNNS